MLRPVLLPCLWLTAAAAHGAVPQADRLWQAGDYRGAFAQAFEPALRGDAHAQFLLGEAYRLGRSVNPDFPLAQDWYAKAARQGDLAAAAELGLLLASRRQPTEALPWLSLAARHGDTHVLPALAALYFNGDGITRDPVLAFALMTRAAAADISEAKDGLATLRAFMPPDEQASGIALAAAGWAGALPHQESNAGPVPGGRGIAPVRIQVGAFRSASAAEAAWSSLTGRIDGIGHVDHAVVRAGRFYRLQARLADPQSALAFDRKLSAAGWAHLQRPGA